MKDPHYYSYEFVSSKGDDGWSFEAKAYGDLDCDGQYSTFTLMGAAVGGEVLIAEDLLRESARE